MAATTYATNQPNVVKLFSRKLFREALKQTTFAPYMGESSDSMIQVLNDTRKGPGDKITYQLRMQLSGAGVAGDGTLEGNEDWWADRIDAAIINQLAGVTTQSDLRYTGQNATAAPSTGRNLWIDDSTTDASLVAADSFSLAAIDKCVATAKVSTPLIRPLMVGGESMYVMHLHPYQVYSLRQTTSTGGWQDIQKFAMMGKGTRDNPIFTGALGVYNNVILRENSRIPSITSNTRRAIFCGAQAATFAVGQNNNPEKMSWTEELFDYENQLGVSAGMIFGVKKSVFNSTDFGVLTMNTYAAAP